MVVYSKTRCYKRKGSKCTRKIQKSIKVSKTDGDLTYNNVKQQKWWISFSPDLLYIWRDKIRFYWILSKVRPEIKFNDEEKTIKVTKHKLVLKSPTVYKRIKEILTE